MIWAIMLLVDPVVFVSPTVCRGNHGVYRWSAKTDSEKPPSSGVSDVKPSGIAKWPEPTVRVKSVTGRVGRENEWYRVEGRVVELRAEADGDVHLVLADAAADSVNVVVEVPVGEPWSEVRARIFAELTDQKFPFSVSSGRKLKLKKSAVVVVVVGKAFFDGEHRGAEPNRRSSPPNTAVWEVHPVMSLSLKR